MSATSSGRTALAASVTRLLMRYRWIYVVPLLLPASKAFSLCQAARDRRRSRGAGAPERHEQRVAAMQEELRRWREQGSPGKLCTARRDWESIAMSQLESYKARHHPVAVPLYAILGIDASARTVRVEPGVTMGRLTAYLLSAGWTLPVVPELEDLTVGGLLLGYGIETSSHRCGLFADNVACCDVLLADGRVVRASREEHAELFRALPFSRGALGFVTAVELEIVPASRFVRLEYHPAGSAAELAATLSALVESDAPPSFVEGFLFAADEGVVVTGELTNSAPLGSVNRVGLWYKPWFHEHVRVRARRPVSEHVPLRQYYHRHSRAIFWAAALLVPFGNEPLFRYTLGWLMPPKISFLKLTETPGLRRAYSEQMVSQEGLVPLEHLVETVELCQELYDVYPMWICPALLSESEPPGLAGPPPGSGAQQYVDVGVFFSVPGPVARGEPWSARPAVRRFEQFLREHHGFPSTYAVSEMTRDDFWATFDRRTYDAARAAYGAEGAFLDAYEKLKRL
jgi:delta24-sterol reductase